jgi:hypothetical protein
VVEAPRMKRGRNTLILLVLALGLGGYIYFVESKREPASNSDEPPVTHAKVFTVDAAKIEEISVKGSAGEQTTLRKSNNAWQVVAPVQSSADENESSGLATSLATLEEQRVIEEQPKDLAPYGLAPARLEITFKAAGDAAPRHLLVGDKTATGGDLYAKLADKPKVFLIPASVDGSFDKTTFQLRDKSVLKVDREKADGISVERAKTMVQLARQGDLWSMKQPWTARADFGAVESLLSRVSQGQMKSIVTDDPAAPLKDYGLDAPDTKLSLTAGSTSAGLLIGKASPQGDLYAKDVSRPLIFTIEKAFADDIAKAPTDFRMKDAFGFRAYTGTRIEVARGTSTVVFEKKKGPEKDAVEKWAMVQPAKAVDDTKIDELAGKVAGLRAESFVEALPKDAAEAGRISTKFDEGRKQEVVTLHRTADAVYATRADEAGAAKVPTADVDGFFAAVDALVKSEPPKPAAPAAKK